jgi:hypothetical protein
VDARAGLAEGEGRDVLAGGDGPQESLGLAGCGLGGDHGRPDTVHGVAQRGGRVLPREDAGNAYQRFETQAVAARGDRSVEPHESHRRQRPHAGLRPERIAVLLLHVRAENISRYGLGALQ